MRTLPLFLAVLISHAATVNGRITSVVGNTPVSRATVVLNGNGRPYTAESGADGTFRIEGVPAGVYTPAAQRRGFVTPEKSLPELFIAQGEDAVLLNLRMTPTGVISGRVLDADGDPLSRIYVQAMQYTYTQGTRQLQMRKAATSNDRGEYRIYDLPPGRYFLRAGGPMAFTPGSGLAVLLSKPLGTAPTYYLHAPSIKSATAVNLSPGEELASIDLHSGAQAVYTVRAPLPSGGILYTSVQRLNDTESLGSFATNVRNGVLQIPDLSPGSYLLSGQWVENGESKQRSCVRQPFEIVDRDIELGELKLIRGVEVTGILEGAARNTTVVLSPLTPNPATRFSTVPGADGSFRIGDVAPEDYWFRLTIRPGTYLASIRSGEREWTTQQVDLTRPVGLVRVTLGTDGGEVVGLVTDAAGSPVNHALVALAPAKEGWPDRLKTATTDQGGNLRIEDIAPGAYRAFAWEDAESGAAADDEFRRLYESKATAITVAADLTQKITLMAIPATVGK